jgi:hypothetical protein
MSSEIESKNVGATEGIHEKATSEGYRTSDVELPIDAQVETCVAASITLFYPSVIHY